jgi:hypothetical protein
MRTKYSGATKLVSTENTRDASEECVARPCSAKVRISSNSDLKSNGISFSIGMISLSRIWRLRAITINEVFLLDSLGGHCIMRTSKAESHVLRCLSSSSFSRMIHLVTLCDVNLYEALLKRKCMIWFCKLSKMTCSSEYSLSSGYKQGETMDTTLRQTSDNNKFGHR